MISVFHNPDFVELTFSKDIGNEIKPHLDNLKQIAEVDTDDLDVAYRLTNNIEDSWTKNNGVALCGPESDFWPDGFRSTSIGDCMEKDGQLYVVAPMGFEEVK